MVLHAELGMKFIAVLNYSSQDDKLIVVLNYSSQDEKLIVVLNYCL